jgi:uncharacterized membrane protein
MDILQILLRIVHVLSSITWMGFGAFTVFILAPAMRSAAVDGSRAWGRILNSSAYPLVMAATPILAMLSGLWLYWEVSDGFYDEYMGSTSGIILSTGVLAGIAAVGHGAGTLGRTTGKLKNLTAVTQNGGELDDKQLADFEEMEAYVQKHAYISLGLMTVALITMVTHPYWG